VADLKREQMQKLARMGARARLEELQREEAAIRRAFPDLSGGRRASTTGRRSNRSSGRRPMSAANRKAVSDRMKRYWADRRKKAAK
jgi:hypothetical protein